MVVGGGISGLAAAHYFRAQAGASARVLVLDNHDDFGGHAKRNEFTHAGRTYIGYGGTQSIDSPAPYSATAKALITRPRHRRRQLPAGGRRQLYRSLGAGGRDVLRQGDLRRRQAGGRHLTQSLEGVPGAVAAARRDQAQILRLNTEKRDVSRTVVGGEEGAAGANELHRLRHQGVGARPGVLGIYQTRTYGLFGFGVDAVPAQDAWALGLPGFQGMQLEPGNGPGQNYDSIRHPDAEDYYFHFPDGNATVARLLVRRLVPAAVPGTSADDVVTSRVDYAKLDDAASPARIRLNSTVMHVAHDGDPAAARG